MFLVARNLKKINFTYKSSEILANIIDFNFFLSSIVSF